MRTPPISIRQPHAARLSPIAAALAVALSQAASAAAPAMPAASTGDQVSAAQSASRGPFVVSPSAPLPRLVAAKSAYGTSALNVRIPGAATKSASTSAGGSPAARGDRVVMGPWNGVWVAGASASLIKDLSGNTTRYYAYGDYGGSVSPSVVDFGDVLVGTTSPRTSVIIRSTGSDPYRIYSMDTNGFNGFCYGVALGAASRVQMPFVPSLCYGGPFICEITCDTATTYATNESCRVIARFAPSYANSFQTTICIYDNTAVSPKSILLKGDGIPPPPLTVTPQQWNFGSVRVGRSSGEHAFTIRSSDPGSYLRLTEIRTTGPFELRGTDCFDLGEGFVSPFHFGYGQECTAIVAFEPLRSGTATGNLVVKWEDLGCDCVTSSTGQVTATLRGTGLTGGELTLPESIEVGTATLGAGPIFRTVELLNSSSTEVTFSSIAVTAPFTLLNHCPVRLEAGATCSVDIGFTAPAVGSFNGTLTVRSDADDRSAAIPVHATGQFIAEPMLLIAPTAMGFGERVIGTQTDSTQVTITNIGGVTATLSLASSTPDFVVGGNTCGPALEPQASCSANVAFRPIGFGLRSGSLVVTSNANDSPQAVSLGGTGCRPFVPSDRSGSGTNCAP